MSFLPWRKKEPVAATGAASASATAPPATIEPAVVVGAKPTDDQIDCFGLTHAGKVRKSNQDHFLICSLHRLVRLHGTSLTDLGALPVGSERMAFLAMVADGVGSGARGGEASRHAVEWLTRYVAEAMQAYYVTDATAESFLSALNDAALRAHASMQELAQADADLEGMATTLTLLLFVWPWVNVLQVGDSRYYRLEKGELIQVTRDQTMAAALVEQGVFTPEEAGRTRWANVLASSLGGKQTAPVVSRLPSTLGAVHLLCSDGLTKHVSDDRIKERLATMTSARQACEALVDDALEGGGSDNVTVVVGRALPRPTT
jgi:protein phosphatase